MHTCSSCQARNAGHSAFCIRCGAPLEGHARDAASHTDALAMVAEQTPRMLVDEAAAQLADGQATAAIENCRRAIALNPREVEAFAVLGMAFEQNGDLQSALDSYETALNLSPERPVERQKASLLRLRLGHERPTPQRERTQFSWAHAWQWVRNQVTTNPALAAGLAAALLVFVIGAIVIVSAGRARAATALEQQYAYQVQLGDQALAEQRYAEAALYYQAAWGIAPGDAGVVTKWEQAYQEGKLLAEQQQRQMEIAALPKYIPNITGRNPFTPVPIEGQPPAATAATAQQLALAGAQIPVPPPTVNSNTTRPFESVQGQGRSIPPSTTTTPSSRRDYGTTNPNRIITPVAPQPGKGATPPPAADTTAKPPKGEITIWVTQNPPGRTSEAATPRVSTSDAENLRARGEQLARDGNTADAISHLERAASAFEERARQDSTGGSASSQAASSCRARIEVLRQANR